MASNEVPIQPDNSMKVVFTRDDNQQLFGLFCTAAEVMSMLETLGLEALNAGGPLFTDEELQTATGQSLSAFLGLNPEIRLLFTQVINRQLKAFTGHRETEWQHQLEQAVAAARAEGFNEGMVKGAAESRPSAITEGQVQGIMLLRAAQADLKQLPADQLLRALTAMKNAGKKVAEEAPPAPAADTNDPEDGAGTTH